ncbi:MAG: exonuclease SbcCD subunit D [Oscillospiraceae bacterium]|nr:exonuclease SbcCD subunit D [Oscillospiraceae bacterium]
MRFLHTADLHIGKMLHGQSLLPDQRIMLDEIRRIAAEEAADALLISGDVYQRNNPSAEAMTLFSTFLSELAAAKIPVYIISGNHDSAARVSYLSQLAEQAGVHIAGAEPAQIYSYPLEDAYGRLTIHLLSYCTPLTVRQRFPEQAAEIRTYEDALRTVLGAFPPEGEGRHVLLCHQFLTGAATCDSEELAIGGLDNISASLFDAYDYVALGHLHGAQHVQRETVRYAGSPLRYSFSEVTQKKSVTIIELREKGNTEIRTVPISQPHGMRVLTGGFAELNAMAPSDDFIRVILTDELPPQDAARTLRGIFPNLLSFSIQNSKTREERTVTAADRPMQTDFLTLLHDFYAYQNGGAVMTEAQEQLVRELTDKLDREEGAGK